MTARTRDDCVPEYADNLLIEPCGPILSSTEMALHLNYWPNPPGAMKDIPMHIRQHQLMALRSLHIPTQAGLNLAQMMDLMLRQGYVARNPRNATTWGRIYHQSSPPQVDIPPLAAYASGISGTGKSRAVERTLRLYQQTVVHQKFPHMVGPFTQLLWLKVDVPASGKAVDLAESLMIATDKALGTEFFRARIESVRKRGPEMLREWLDKASAHFLGLLVLDEISNLFKIETLDKRKAAKKRHERPQLRVADDEAIKFILTLNNTSRIPILGIGTPDGMEAFATRLSTAERLITGGFHWFEHADSADTSFFKNQMFPKLCEYQWVDKRLEPGTELRQLCHRLSAGIPRIYIALWCFAHRCAFERLGDSLLFEDFERAMNSYMAPLQPAIDALHSNQPEKLFRYEDLLPRDDSFWAGLFGRR